MTKDELIEKLDALDGGDPEMAHCLADDLLLEYVDPTICAAYNRLIDRCGWWACA